MLRADSGIDRELKASKYLVIALLVVVILASISWVLRDAIIQRMSGPILSKYGIKVTDVSLDALATKNAAISYLELEYENGTTIALHNLTLPIASSKRGVKTYAAENVTIDTPIDSNAEPPALAQLITQVLSVPETLPNSEIIIATLNVAAYPTVRDLRWSSTADRQELTAQLDAVYLAFEINAKDEDGFEARFSLKQTSLKAPEQSITTEIRRSDEGMSLSGASALDLPITGAIVSSIAASLGMKLAGVEFADGTAILELEAEIPFDSRQPASVVAYLKPAAPLELAYSVKSGVVNVVSLRSASPIKLDITYPETQWSITVQQASLSMSYNEWNDVSASITDLNCSTGPSCYMTLNVSMDNADLTFGTADRLELEAMQDVIFGEDEIQLFVRPGAAIELTGLSVAGTELAGLTAVTTSSATLDLSESGLGFAAESLDAAIESLALDDVMDFSALLSLRNLSVSDLDQALSIIVDVDAASSELAWGEQKIAFPGFNGDVSLKDDKVVAGLTTVGLHSNATISAEHDLGSESGRLAINGGGVSFDALKLSGRISPWTDDWDITAGTISTDLQVNWKYKDSGWQLDGQSSLIMTDLSGAYAESAFGGLSTQFAARFDPESGVAVEPAKITIGLLEIGLPIEAITADYTLQPNDLSVDVENLSMQAFGGVVTADPFRYELQRESNSLLLRAESIELTELLTLKEFEAIELSGRIGAELPLIIEGAEISILDGTLTGEAPGGVIRYQSGLLPDGAETSAIGIVTEALSNFEYDTLTSTVGYSKHGDLVLQMQIAGRNPNLEENRPVVLNLGVETNIPQMLRSLQAARAVEDILEKRIEKRNDDATRDQ